VLAASLLAQTPAHRGFDASCCRFCDTALPLFLSPSLAAAAGGATTLTPGLPFQDNIPTAWDYNYYVFQAGSDTARITIGASA
jgi:hypothetical protein